MNEKIFLTASLSKNNRKMCFEFLVKILLAANDLQA